MERYLFFESGFASNKERLNIVNPENIKVPKDKFQFLKNEINSFVVIGENWDGYGALCVLDTIAHKTETLVGLLSSSLIDHVSDIFPNPHGTITIEWENRSGEKLSLEIGNSNYSYFIKFNESNPKLINGEDIFVDFKDFTKDLGELFGGEITKYLL